MTFLLTTWCKIDASKGTEFRVDSTIGLADMKTGAGL